MFLNSVDGVFCENDVEFEFACEVSSLNVQLIVQYEINALKFKHGVYSLWNVLINPEINY